MLGGNVSDRTGHADQASDGTVIHNCAFSTFEHFRNFIFHAKPDAGQVSCHDAMPILFTRRHNSCDRPNQASVVEREVQGRGSLCLTVEAAKSLRVWREPIREELQGNLAVQFGVLSLIHNTHTTTAKLFKDAVV